MPAGTDAVSWFTQNMEGIETTQQAQNVGQRLLGLGIITEIEGTSTPWEEPLCNMLLLLQVVWSLSSLTPPTTSSVISV